MQSSSGNGLGTALNMIKQDLTDYLNMRLRWLKISYQEQFSQVISMFLYGVLLTAIVFIILFFSLIGLALFIGRLLDDSLAGFAVMSGVGLLALAVLLTFRRRIKDFFLNKSVLFMMRMDKDEDDDLNMKDDATAEQ